jgi:apolipoprotein N-acyltransferase
MNDVFFDNSRDVYRAGFKIISVPIAAAEEKSRRTFYNRYGDVFGWSCVGVTALVLLLTKFASRRRKSVHRNSRV